MDFALTYDGSSLMLLEPRTEAAQDWIDRHLSGDALHWGAATVVEFRYIEPIIVGIMADGLTVTSRGCDFAGLHPAGRA